MPSHSSVQYGSGWKVEKQIACLCTLRPSGISGVCIHAYIYRQLNALLKSASLFSIKRVLHGGKNKCCAAKGESHLIQMRVRGEIRFSILSNEAAQLSFCL